MNSPEPGGAMTFPGEGFSEDAFYAGRFHLVQPRGRGYRSGLDALLLAAAVPKAARGRLVDLGAGAGAVGLACAVRAPMLAVTLVESAAIMADCARRGLASAQNHAIAPRVTLIETDLTQPRAHRAAAGLEDGVFDWVVANPPFYGAAHRRSPDALRAQALNADGPEAIARWIAVAGALSRHGGGFAMILPPDMLGVALPACDGRFGDLGLGPIHAKPAAPALRVLLTGRRGARAPLRLLPACHLADGEGGETDFARGIALGTADIAGFAQGLRIATHGC